MSYKHILVAIDLTEESKKLIEKGVDLAKSLNAELSFIHIDSIYSETYPEQIVAQELVRTSNNPEIQKKQEQLISLSNSAGYPIKHILVGSENIEEELTTAVQSHNIDLVVYGHHQGSWDFWHSITSSSKKVLKYLPVEILIVPLQLKAE